MKDDDNLQNPHLSSMASGPDDLGRIFRLPVSSRLAASGITDRIPLSSCYNTSRLGAGTGTAARPDAGVAAPVAVVSERRHATSNHSATAVKLRTDRIETGRAK